ncbi:MAG: tetratricopeptide repeat-containing sensor histidine kinase [Ignavibacteria bacterium]|nr:tetratricopeptide repeat-containing sensor histidine kinase [Ignavibacteria bacterium]
MMRKISTLLSVLFLFVVFFIGEDIYSQQKIEALEGQIETLSGKEKIKALITLSEYYQKNSLDKAIRFSEQGIIEAEKMNFKKEYAEALIIRGFCYYLTNTLDSAKLFFNKSLAIGENLNDSNIVVNSLTNLGLIFWRKGNYNEAFRNYFEAQKILHKINNKQLLGKTSNYIGLIYWKRGDYADALEYFIKSLSIKEELGDKSEIAITLNNIARIYFELGDSREALQYSIRAHEISILIKDKYTLGRALNNLSNAHFLIGNYKEAEDYQIQSIKIKEEANDITGLGYSYNDLGNIYFKLNRHSAAIVNFRKALELRAKLFDYFGISESLLSLAEVYKSIGKKDSAYLLLNQSIMISGKQNLRELKRKSYFLLSEFNKSDGRLAEALYFFEKYTEVKDSIMSQKNREKISELQIIYESVNKQKEIDLLKKEKDLHEFELATQERSTLVLIGTTLVLIASMIFLFYRLQIERRLKQSVQEKNNEITITAAKLEEANITKDKFFSIIAHDLRSPFLGLRGLIDYLNDEYDDIPDELKREQLNLIGKNIKNIFMLIQNLLTWAQIQKGTIPFTPESIALKRVAEMSINLHEYIAANKQIKVYNNIPLDITAFADENMVHSILNNLISNGIKFTNKGGTVTLTAIEKNNFVEISVLDNGVGMTEEETNKIFDITAKHSTYGTEEEKGTGLGLTICQEMVELNGGFISVKTEPGKGTEFKFTLPLIKND